MHSLPEIGCPEHSGNSGQAWNGAFLGWALGLVVGMYFPARADAHSAPSGWSTRISAAVTGTVSPSTVPR